MESSRKTYQQVSKPPFLLGFLLGSMVGAGMTALSSAKVKQDMKQALIRGIKDATDEIPFIVEKFLNDTIREYEQLLEEDSRSPNLNDYSYGEDIMRNHQAPNPRKGSPKKASPDLSTFERTTQRFFLQAGRLLGKK